MIEKILNYGEDFHIEDIKKEGNKNVIYIKSNTSSCKCPKCKEISTEKHSTYKRKIQDTPIQNIETYLVVNAYEYECSNKKCEVTTFNESLPFARKNKVMTDNLIQLILSISIFMSSSATSLILSFLGVKVSADTIDRIICIEKKYTNYILDADIKGYFDNINHDLIMKALEMHIKDTNLLRLIKRFLKAGIMENGKYITSEYGTPQGSILSPVLANIVMYYGIILYVEKIKKVSRGYIEIINYADDMILCFQHKDEAEKTYKLLKKRLKQLGLEFAEDKTRLIEFGRFASENCRKNGKNKSDTFDFLGFTHYCSKGNKYGNFRVKRKTSKKKFKQKIQEFKVWIKEHRNEPLKEIIATVKKKLTGHFNYYGITDNSDMIARYHHIVILLLIKWLNRRSQKKSYRNKGFTTMIKFFDLPQPRIKVNIYAI